MKNSVTCNLQAELQAPWVQIPGVLWDFQMVASPFMAKNKSVAKNQLLLHYYINVHHIIFVQYLHLFVLTNVPICIRNAVCPKQHLVLSSKATFQSVYYATRCLSLTCGLWLHIEILYLWTKTFGYIIMSGCCPQVTLDSLYLFRFCVTTTVCQTVHVGST